MAICFELLPALTCHSPLSLLVGPLSLAQVPGAYELPFAAQAAILARKEQRPSAVICIGVLIKGSTMHFEYICEAVTQGITRVGLDTKVPVIFGVLTCLTDDQAKLRAGFTVGGELCFPSTRCEKGAGHYAARVLMIPCVLTAISFRCSFRQRPCSTCAPFHHTILVSLAAAPSCAFRCFDSSALTRSLCFSASLAETEGHNHGVDWGRSAVHMANLAAPMWAAIKE